MGYFLSMTLDEYLTSQKLTDESFGEQIGRSKMQVSRYRRGLAMPRKPVMDKIAEVTQGAVTAASFYSQPQSGTQH